MVTNPDGDTTKLEKTDLVFVLARQDPGDPDHWDDYNGNTNMFDAKQNKIMTSVDEMMLR